MSTTEAIQCACPDCSCEVTDGHRVERGGQLYCGEACANGHESGAGCCEDTCQCCG